MKKGNYLLLMYLLVFVSCDYAVDIMVENRSSKTVVACADVCSDHIYSEGKIFPYTANGVFRVIDSQKKQIVWSSLVNSPDETIDVISEIATVAFIDPDTLEKYGRDDVIRNNRTLIVYDIRKKQWDMFDKHVIIYPPQPWMKEIRMYPTYDEFWNTIEQKDN